MTDQIDELRELAKAAGALDKNITTHRRALEDVAKEIGALANALDSGALRSLCEQIRDVVEYLDDRAEDELDDLATGLMAIADELQEASA